MKFIVADVYDLYVHNSKHTKFPKRFRNYKIIWNLRDVLFQLWEGTVTELAIPELGTPGYNFEEFCSKLVEIGQIKDKPKFTYYQLEVIKKY